jgi:two-component system, OmpR family, sensor kinase
MTRAGRRGRQAPIWTQITALLLGALVVAQIATVMMAVVLPLQPPPRYSLRVVADALRGGPLQAANMPPLQRGWQAEPPATTSPGWQVSTRPRQELAKLLGANEEDVRLLFYSPPPFAGTAPPPGARHPGFPPDSGAPSGPREGPTASAKAHGRVVDASLLPTLLIFGPPGGPGGWPGGGPGGPGGGRGRGPGGPGGRGGDRGDRGGWDDRGADRADWPGGGVQVDPPITPVVVGAPDGPQPGDAPRRPSAPNAPDGPIITAPSAASPAPSSNRPAATAQTPQASAPLRPPPLPATTPAQPPAVIARAAPTRGSRIVREIAEEDTGRPAQTLAAPPSPSLFGFVQNPSVHGEFVAALRVGPHRWEVVRPAQAGLVSAWQRRVLLWFALVFAAVAPIGYLFARRLAAPLATLADAADRLGRDPSAPVRVGGGSAEIERVAAAFTGMQARLQRYVEDRTAMVGAISHDLRTPLARMRFRLEKAPETLRAGMLHDVAQMEEMVSAVLAFIRDAAEPGVRERVDLRSILECVIDDAALTDRDATLAAGPPAPVEVDIPAVQRLLTNLVENALKYGGKAEASLAAEGDEAVVRIADEGPGLPEAELERVFMPFYRSSESRTLNSDGIGLGLSVSRSIARAHGGDVRLCRAEQGLVAELRLPLARAAPPPAPAPSRPSIREYAR